MLDVLKSTLLKLPSLLKQYDVWDSLLINRRKPTTYRIFTQIPDTDYRVCLHKFLPCETEEAFLHPHPWSGAFLVLRGRYEMNVGYSEDRISQPYMVMTTELSRGSMYEISNPLTWHSVVPLEETYTIMVNSRPWDSWYAHQDVRTTKGKDLEKLDDSEKRINLAIFWSLLNDHLCNISIEELDSWKGK